MSLQRIKLKIADIRIVFNSRLAHARLYSDFKRHFINFLDYSNKKADIQIEVKVVSQLPEVKAERLVFHTYHPEEKVLNWSLFKNGRSYIFINHVKEVRQVIYVNSAFNKVTAYLLPGEQGKKRWHVMPLIYDFLQILLINYFAKSKLGIFVHGFAVKDTDQKGYLFAGKSGAGKSTTAKIWHKYAKAMILNDDRVIIRKQKGKFYIYGSPWHGNFYDYLTKRMEPAVLSKIFLIYHALVNKAEKVSCLETFKRIYPCIFPAFWDRVFLNNTTDFCRELVSQTDCLRLGFVKNRSIIPFTRKLYHAPISQKNKNT